uniref:Uncharacterized protein n=1 Tax=Setaria italica TaxID=4555 RepID=K3YNJ9_SETIT
MQINRPSVTVAGTSLTGEAATRTLHLLQATLNISHKIHGVPTPPRQSTTVNFLPLLVC